MNKALIAFLLIGLLACASATNLVKAKRHHVAKSKVHHTHKAVGESFSVNASNLRIRSTPSTQGEIITEIPRGTVVQETAAPSEGPAPWKYVTTPAGDQGWASGDYLVPASSPVTVTPTPSPAPADDSGADDGAADEADTGSTAVLPDLCFPIARGDYTTPSGVVTDTLTRGSFGQSRCPQSQTGTCRCHKGQDMFTGRGNGLHTLGRVLAITDGVVTGVMRQFTKCHDGWIVERNAEGVAVTAPRPSNKAEHPAYAVTVHHPSLNLDVVYGESTLVFVREGEQVRKGQLLSLNTVCEMLHIEFYDSTSRDKRRSGQLPWHSPETTRVCNTAQSSLPGSMKNSYEQVGQLVNKYCPAPSATEIGAMLLNVAHPFQRG